MRSRSRFRRRDRERDPPAGCRPSRAPPARPGRNEPAAEHRRDTGVGALLVRVAFRVRLWPAESPSPTSTRSCISADDRYPTSWCVGRPPQVAPYRPAPTRLASGRPPGGKPASRNARGLAAPHAHDCRRAPSDPITGWPSGLCELRPPPARARSGSRSPASPSPARAPGRGRTCQPRELGGAHPDPRRERDRRGVT
jgi:hypothetical protein